jgi:hypothetical protein
MAQDKVQYQRVCRCWSFSNSMALMNTLRKRSGAGWPIGRHAVCRGLCRCAFELACCPAQAAEYAWNHDGNSLCLKVCGEARFGPLGQACLAGDCFMRFICTTPPWWVGGASILRRAETAFGGTTRRGERGLPMRWRGQARSALRRRRT